MILFLTKDGVAFGWTYYVSDTTVFVNKMERDFEWYHQTVSMFNAPFLVALWSRLAEIGIRTAFILLTLTVALIFNELDDRIEKIADISSPDNQGDVKDLQLELDRWMDHYNLTCALVEKINRTFGLVLLIISGFEFSNAIMEFNSILRYLQFLKTKQLDLEYQAGNVFTVGRAFAAEPSATCIFTFLHIILRYLAILVVAYRVGEKASKCKNF